MTIADRWTTAAACALLAACATSTVGQATLDPIPGVENRETNFFASGLETVLRGDADVLFARAAGRWYRVALNEGCLRGVTSNNPAFTFRNEGSSKVDRFTKVTVVDGGGMPFTCQVQSIRGAMAPPMVDSDSIVPRG